MKKMGIFAVALMLLFCGANLVFADDSSDDSVLNEARRRFNEGNASATPTPTASPEASASPTAAAATAASAEATASPSSESNQAESYPEELFCITLLPGMNFPEGNLIANIAFGPISSDVYGVHGAQVAGIFSNTKGDMVGVQIAGVRNLSEGMVKGIQIAGVFSIANGTLFGAQISGVFNNVGNGGSYAQVAGVFNVAGRDFAGIQIAGVFNENESIVGGQVAGIFNKSGNVLGFQIAGVFNMANDVKGIQIGLVNIASHVSGVQIGLINYCESIDGVPIGLINIVKQGVSEIGIFYEDTDNGYFYMKRGSSSFYGLVYFGGPASTYFKNTTKVQAGFGFGNRFSFAGFYLDSDLSYKVNINNLDYNRFWRGLPFASKIDQYITAKIAIGYKLFNFLKIQAGIAVDFDCFGVGYGDRSAAMPSALNVLDLGFARIPTYGRFFIGIGL